MNLSPPSGLRPPAKPAEYGEAVNSGNTQWFIIAAAIILLITASLLVFVFPARFEAPVSTPKTVPGPEAMPAPKHQAIIEKTAPVIQDPPVRTSEPAPTTPSPNIKETSVVQQDAQQALQAFLRQRAQAPLANAERWAPQQWAAALTQADEGDVHYGYRRFGEALKAYQSATDNLIRLQQQRPEILQQSLDNGRSALSNNEVETAITAFEQALAIDANHPVALAGLQRAKVRPQVLAQMALGLTAKNETRLQDATDAYARANSLDPDYLPAQKALETARAILDRQHYQQAMSLALQALQSGKFKTAEQALDRAAAIQADATEIKDARRRLHQARQQARLNDLRQRSQVLAGKEQWQKASALYRQALAIDANAGFARNGLKHAESRIKLHQQLDHYLTQPERLYSAEPLNNAGQLLLATSGQINNEPELAAKLEALKVAVKEASTPVALKLQSDGLTAISIYHVGRLGTLTDKQLMLTPGLYTIVGSREGYRDVRTQVDLKPGRPASIRLACKELI